MPSFTSLRASAAMTLALGLAALTGCASALDETGADALSPLDEGAEPSLASDEAGELGALQQPLFGSDACRNVYVAVRNFLNDPITVRSLEYYNVSEGRWQTENLANRTLSANGGLEIWIEDLEHAENDLISSANLLYDHVGHTHDEHFNIPDANCVAGAILFDLFVE